MVLDYVADGACSIIKTSPALHAEVLRHGDLHTLDVCTGPERFYKSISKAKRHHVIYCPLAEVVVNAEDVTFVEGSKQNGVQRLTQGQLARPRPFDTEPPTPRTLPLG